MKKRFFLLLALTAALLLAFGMSTALATTADDGHTHWAWCDNPTECAECGEPYSGDDIRHDWSNDYQCDETQHWKYCARCGEELDRGEHGVWCDEPGVCAWCGASYSGDNITHDWSDYQYNDTEHWLVCNRCGEELDRGEHGAWCDEPGVCAWCGMSYSGDNITHDWSDWQTDGIFHWKVCTLCGTVGNKEGHYVSCNNQNNQCRVCGAACENPLVTHSWDGYTHDDLYHWYECLNCGKALARDAHYAYCDAPGVCAECGYEKAGIPIYHDQDISNFTIDKYSHTSTCSRCGRETIEAHYVLCTNPGVCVVCGAAVSDVTVQHTYSDYKSDADYHWYTCVYCGQEQKKEHERICTGDNTCYFCGQPYSGDNVQHHYDETNFQYQHDETNHWCVCIECGEKYDVEAHVYDNDGVCTVCEYSKPVVTDAPTTAPTDVPTEAPTEVPTEAPTAVPTEVPTKVPTEAPTETPTEAPTEAPTAAPTAAPTKAPHKHVFRTYVFRSEGMHWSKCEVCGYGVTQRCVPESTTVNGVPCEVCGICGHTTVPEMTGISLPEEPMADAAAVAAEGEAAPVLVYDLTPALPEDSVFALCLQVVPQDGAAMPGDMQITVPCALDTANLRLVFIADGAQPVEVPFETADGMLTFTAAAPGVYALTPVQE